MSPASSSSRVLRVLFVDVSSRRGGAEASLDELLAALVARGGFSLALATARDDIAQSCPVFAIPPVRLRRPSRVLPFLRSLAALWRTRRALARIIRDFRPDIVHANGIAAVFALPRTRARILWHVRDWPRRPYAALAARRCEAVLAISHPVENALHNTIPATCQCRIYLVENGIALQTLTNLRVSAPSAALRETSGPVPNRQTVKPSNRQTDHSNGYAVGMVAHLVPWKRHDLFIEAAILLRDFRDAKGRPITWVIAGSDLFGEHADYISALRKRINAAGLADRFIWLEGCSAAEILPSLDLLVHPTAEEPFGRVICEAMAAGVPVVACDSAGPGSILSDGKTGFLFPKQVESGKWKVVSGELTPLPATAAAIAERIRYALTHPDECAAVVAAAKAVVRDRYAIERVAEEIAALYTLANDATTCR